MDKETFLAKHGFPGIPAGDRMKEDLEKVITLELELQYLEHE